MNPLGYRSGSTPVHLLDVRIKFAVMLLVSLSIIKAGPLHLALLICGQMVLLCYLGYSFKSVLTELRSIFVLLSLVFIVRSITMPGEALLQVGWFSVTRQGVLSGALITARMLLVVLLGMTLVITTRPTAIKTAVEWFLMPFPGLPRVRIGTMLGLLLRLIPLLTAQAGETMDAQRARGVENRKNPIYRLTWFAIPFLRRSFAAVDRLSMAMEARCYTDDRTTNPLSAGRRDWFVLSAGAVYAIIVLVT
jgi:energy-coupling factor transporter transmembrane protein EcfT